MTPKYLLRSAAAFLLFCGLVEGQDGITVSLNETAAPNDLNETVPPNDLNETAVPVDSTMTEPPVDGGTISPAGTPAPAPTTLPPKPECFDNTDLLFDFVEAKEPFTPEEFILCPNRVYELGVLIGPDNTCCLDGQAPLAARSNTRIICGADGRLENNCTIVGGQFQVIVSFFTFLEVTNNAVYEGITFEESAFAGLLLENDGDISFKNCAIKNHSGIAPVIAAYYPDLINPSRRLREAHRQLKHLTPRQRMAYIAQEHAKRLSGEINFFDRFLEKEEQGFDEQERDNLHRELQVTPRYRMDVFFENILFAKNERGTLGGEEKLGVITSEGVNEHFIMKGCLFEDNQYGDELDVRGYMMQISDGSCTLDIQDTCFVNNNVVGPGLILLNSTEVLTQNANISITADNDVQCQFVAVETKDEMGNSVVNCVGPAASTTCTAPFDVPSDVVFISSAAGSAALSWMFNVLLLVVPVLLM